MTDRINALIVVLEHDTRDDDMEATIAAIEQLRGVIKVSANVVGPDSYVAEQRVRYEFGRKMFEFLYPPTKPPT